MAPSEEVEEEPRAVEGVIYICDIPVVVLFDSGASVSFISASVLAQLDLQIDRLDESVVVATPIGRIVELRRICRGCPLNISGVTIKADLIVMNMRTFDVILGMD